MEGIVITHKGMEQVAAAEVEHILGVGVKAGAAHAAFSVSDIAELAKLAYFGQSFRRVLLELAVIVVSDVDTMAAELGKADLTAFCAEGQTFAVECERVGEHDFSSQDLAIAVGEKLAEKSDRTVDLKKPDVTVYVHVQDEYCVAGIDVAGFDLSKRHWRIFSQSPLRPTVARALLAYAGYANGKVLLDPFCRDGAIGITAYCMATGRSSHVYGRAQFGFQKFIPDIDQHVASWGKLEQPLSGEIICSAPQFGEVKGAEKNAKIAGIKGIQFRRIENDWLDLKFVPESVDCVVSVFPQPGARHPPKVLERMYRETLKLLAEILKRDGRICTISNPLLETAARDAGFTLLETHEVWQGKLGLRVGVFGKA